jgi:putative redox protein
MTVETSPLYICFAVRLNVECGANNNTIREQWFGKNSGAKARDAFPPCAMLLPGVRIMTTTSKATVRFVADDLFVGITPSGRALVLDTDSQRSAGPSPVELLLVALGACTATDVASILKKKRQQVTSYTVEVTGERRSEYPRSYTSMRVHHILTGRAISAKAVAHAVELSENKYCSVSATLKPKVEIQTTFEIIEEARQTFGSSN